MASSVADTLARLQRQVADEIPLARATGMTLALDEHDAIRAQAPFDANRNMHGTAFGGSLYVVALVAGFAQTCWLLERAGFAGEVVVQRAEADYRQPHRAALDARIVDAPEDFATFVATYARRRRARLTLHVVIGDAFTLTAQFVAREAGNAG